LVHDRTHQPDVEQLRRDYPLWDISAAWAARTSGPDFRVLTACRGGLRLAGFSAPELVRMMTGVEAQYGWPHCAG
jgi:hypothetical protein